jgi:hypothetical protein
MLIDSFCRRLFPTSSTFSPMKLLTWLSSCRSGALSVSLFVVLFGVTACAVQTGPNGQLKIGLDDAEIFGRKISTFKTLDGGEGSLRVLNGRFSVKLHSYAKIIPIDNVMTARILRTHYIDGRTVVILEKGERYCNYKYTVLSILGNEVLTWDVGDCNTQAQISADDHNVYLDFYGRYSNPRFVYRDMRLLRGEVPTRPVATSNPMPTMASLPRPNNSGSPNTRNNPNNPNPAGGSTSTTANNPSTAGSVGRPRYHPPLPILASTGTEAVDANTEVRGDGKVEIKTPKESAPPKKTNTVATGSSTPPALPTKMDFPMTEQKPVRIVLDK